jgi:uncharacterized protein YheU (UPF0270 family)
LIKIPPEELSHEALLGVVDAFVLREGTDYGHRDIPLEEKRDRVLKMLAVGTADICFHPENGHIEILLAE